MLDYIIDRLYGNKYGGLEVNLLSMHHTLSMHRDMVHTRLLAAKERKASHMVLLDYRSSRSRGLRIVNHQL